MKDCKPRNTPFLLGVKLEEACSSPMVNNTLHRQLIGCFLYLKHTRPNIYYVVSVASRYIDQPHEIHWRAAKMILNFVQGTRTHGIFYKDKSDLDLIGEVKTQIKSQHQYMCSFLVKDQSAGQARNRVPLHSHLQKQSTEEL